MTRTAQDCGTPPCETVKCLLAVVSGKLRFQALLVLSAGPRDVGTLSRDLGQHTSYVSRTLRELHRAGMVEYTQAGKRRIYGSGRHLTFRRRGENLVVTAVAACGSRVTIECRCPVPNTERPGPEIRDDVHSRRNGEMSLA